MNTIPAIVVATTPDQMAEQQRSLIAHVEQRIRAAAITATFASESAKAMERAGFVGPALRKQRAIIKLQNRAVEFYRKVGAILERGHAIVPPFDAQVFAVRTNRARPNRDESTQWSARDHVATLPIGEGRWVNPAPMRAIIGTEKRKRADGGEYTVNVYANAQFDDVLLPPLISSPRVIEATRSALTAKIFDALAIAPAYRSADPVIVGRINHALSHRPPLNFFVAWWLDMNDV